MTYFWIAVAFWAGFCAGWWAIGLAVRRGLLREDVQCKVLETMPHEKLLRFEIQVQAELDKRRKVS